jgi:hypothetical protein
VSTSQALPRRPLGITISCWILGINAAAGFRGATILRDRFLSVDPEALRAPASTVGAILSGVAIAYGVTALTATIGLRKMRAWAPRAFVVWALVAYSYAVVASALLRITIDVKSLLQIAGVDLAFVAITFAWWRYIRRVNDRIGAL